MVKAKEQKKPQDNQVSVDAVVILPCLCGAKSILIEEPISKQYQKLNNKIGYRVKCTVCNNHTFLYYEKTDAIKIHNSIVGG